MCMSSSITPCLDSFISGLDSISQKNMNNDSILKDALIYSVFYFILYCYLIISCVIFIFCLSYCSEATFIEVCGHLFMHSSLKYLFLYLPHFKTCQGPDDFFMSWYMKLELIWCPFFFTWLYILVSKLLLK